MPCCELCRYWRRLTPDAIVGECLTLPSGFIYSNAAERCPRWRPAETVSHAGLGSSSSPWQARS